jgi:pimeloyl-ACP methyl ester carboxylesterase
MDVFPGMAIDLPGFGKTKPSSVSLSPLDYAIQLNNILPNEITTIVGHSFGGRVAVHLSLLRNIQNLVLVAVPLIKIKKPNKSINKLTLFKKLYKYGLISKSNLESVKNKMGSADYRNSNGVMRETLVKAVNDDLHEKLGLIQSNVFLIWGENDTEVPVSVANEANLIINNSQLTIIPNEGHNIVRSNPNSLSEVLKTL